MEYQPDVRAKIRPIAEMGIIPNFLTVTTYQNHIFESTDNGQTLDIYAKDNSDNKTGSVLFRLKYPFVFSGDNSARRCNFQWRLFSP